MPNKQPNVTEEEKLLIKKLYTENKLSYSQIGKMINRTGECVGTHLRKMNVENNGIKFKDSEFIIPKYIYRRILYSARKRGIEMNLSIEDMIEVFLSQDRKCPYTGEVLTFGKTSNRSDGIASLDRINSDLNYQKGNVQWIHKHVNIMKRNHSHKYFLELCSKIVKHQNL